MLAQEALDFPSSLSEHLFDLTDENQKRQFIKYQHDQLVEMSNRLNQYLFRDKKIWSSHELASSIRKYYHKSLASFEKMLYYIQSNFPELLDLKLRITDYQLKNIIPDLRNKIGKLKLKLLNDGVDDALINLIIKGINEFLASQKLSILNKGYLTQIISEINGTENINDEYLCDILIRFNFNLPQFYLYLSNNINKNRIAFDGLHEEYEYILREKDSMGNKMTVANQALYYSQSSIKLDLQQFLNEKASYLEELLIHRRAAMKDKLEAEQPFRILLDVPVPVLALFVRMLKETQFILKTGITEVCIFFALHFYTDKAVFISSTNLLKRSTDIEFSTVLKLWDLLTAMQDWLDEKFNVRSMRRSSR